MTTVRDSTYRRKSSPCDQPSAFLPRIAELIGGIYVIAYGVPEL